MALRHEIDDGIGVLTLNRPEVMNAVNRALLTELHGVLQAWRFDRTVRAIVVTGAGDKAFSAGADLKERATLQPDEVRQFLTLIRDTFALVEALPQPVIAALNGLALGGGLEFALACDVRLAAESAAMGLTETALGIIPGAGGTQRLPRLIGPGRAKEMIFTARRVGAREAEAWGLVNRVVPDADLRAAAIAMAQQMAANAPVALAQAKFAVQHGLGVDLASGLAIEGKAYEVCTPTADRIEALTAFREKRKPVFTGA
ncbi:MAG: enoyl-CoA hydratase/isomerase family protein [Candidatus Sericytochromatia bacterium]|nr:enoyl-CoA hydratase/isomerase family protein [Candidatus Sericytochromatia bacterium]